jgi:hypothetical protein
MGSISYNAGSISKPSGSISNVGGTISEPATGTLTTPGSSSPPPPVDPAANLYLRTEAEKGASAPEDLYLRTIEEKE